MQEERRKMESWVIKIKMFPNACFHATGMMAQDWFCLEIPVQMIKQKYYGQECYGPFLWSYCWLFFIKEYNGWKRENGNERKTTWTLWNFLDVQLLSGHRGLATNEQPPETSLCFKTMIKLHPVQARRRTGGGNMNAGFK